MNTKIKMIRWSLMVWLICGLLIAAPPAANVDPAIPQLSLADKEAFLLNAKILKKWHTPRGVANPWQAILDDGKMRHDASIQTIDVAKPSYETPRGTEFHFRDTYKYNVAQGGQTERCRHLVGR